MGVVTIGSNIAALRAQSRLAQATNTLGSVYERLASGQRINRASDDAAGLAVAASLNSSSRVYSQGIRNLNDTISAVNIADSAGAELSTILTRIRELASSAANGVFSRIQRLSLDEEAFALVEEFNRIVESTKFNGLSLLDGSVSSLTAQAGFGVNESIGFDISESLSRTVGTGQFTATATNSPIGFYQGIDTAVVDVDGDGNQDQISYYTDDVVAVNGYVMVEKGNGDGTFQTGVTYTIGDIPVDFALGDVDQDGDIDILTTDSGLNLSVLKNDGNGSFTIEASYSAPDFFDGLNLVDVDGDGDIDAVGTSGNDVGVYYNNGDGTFSVAVTLVDTTAKADEFAFGDFDGDGNQDLVVSTFSGGLLNLEIHLGDGVGNFTKSDDAVAGLSVNSTFEIRVGDFNHDGLDDFVFGYRVAPDYLFDVLVSNGDGTFSSMGSMTASSSNEAFRIADLDGDGYTDLIGGGFYRLGDGDGTFGEEQSFTGTGLSTAFSLGDFNGDGALDFSGFVGGDLVTSINQGTEVNTIGRFNLTTQAKALAALTEIDEAIDRVQNERGTLGATLSRFDFARSHLAAVVENYKSAESRIIDADIAANSAELVRTQILQQAASAVLAQANQVPQIALQLLEPQE